MADVRRKKLKGDAGFEKYYAQVYKERWHLLRAALLKPVRYLSLPPKSENTGKDYFLDAASVLAAFMLPLAGCTSVLDLCAAPGGKSLVLAQRMLKEPNALADIFICNEISASRRARLASVLDSYTDPLIRSRIKITGFDGAKWCRFEQELFDAVLLDAPCSSERHVLQNGKYLAQWSPARIKHLSQTQWALLSSAFRLLKTGGYLLYVTCALSPHENDGTVQKVLKKFESATVVPLQKSVLTLPHALPSYEKTACGFHILPDVQNGSGPLYFSLIQKTEKTAVS